MSTAEIIKKQLSEIQRSPDDGYVTEKLHALIQKRAGDRDHIVNSIGLYMRRVLMARMFARYELFNMVRDLPGSIVELGVFKGESLLMWGKLVDTLLINDRACQVIGFDNFAGFPEFHPKDGKGSDHNGMVPGGWSSKNYYEDLIELIDVFNHDRPAGHKPRIELIPGDIRATVPVYAQENPGIRIKLLHLDCDMYEPTLAGLEAFYPKVVKGGIVILDEYGLAEFAGENAALDDYFKGDVPVVRKLPHYTTPGGYFIK